MIFRGGSEFNDPALDPRRSHNFPLNGFTITPLLFFCGTSPYLALYHFCHKTKKRLRGELMDVDFTHKVHSRGIRPPSLHGHILQETFQ